MNKKNILIIEDDEFFRDLLVKELFLNGFITSQAPNGRVGLDKARESGPDLILLDLLLPDKDGYEVLSALKKDSQTSSIPVLILSNLSSKEDVEKGKKLGAREFLIKSQFSSDEVVAKIKEILK